MIIVRMPIRSARLAPCWACIVTGTIMGLRELSQVCMSRTTRDCTWPFKGYECGSWVQTRRRRRLMLFDSTQSRYSTRHCASASVSGFSSLYLFQSANQGAAAPYDSGSQTVLPGLCGLPRCILYVLALAHIRYAIRLGTRGFIRGLNSPPSALVA